MVLIGVLVIIFIAICVLLIGLSIGVAFLLSWLLPAVGFEMALLVAVIAVGQAIMIFGRVLNSLPPTLANLVDDPDLPITIIERDSSPSGRRGKQP